MMVGTLQMGLYLYGCQSLKEKRIIIKGLKDRIHNQFNASVAEVDYHDKWQRSLLAVACVSNEKKHVEQILDHVLRFTEQDTRIEVVEKLIEIF
jgi:uncharacterized protein YlxP (DUF503 family)